MIIRKPNLFVIGAMKSGTTSLCRQLALHPDVYMAEAKETFYFSNLYMKQGIDEYLANFYGVSREKYVAEGTADYSSFPVRDGVAERIYIFNPKSRFIYIVRDPFDRMISHYQHYVLNGKEQQPLLQALRTDPEYLWRSYYAVQLRPYIHRFGKESVWIGRSEAFKHNPVDFLNNIFRWLNIHELSNKNEAIAANITPRQKILIDQRSSTVKLIKGLMQIPPLNYLVSKGLLDWGRQHLAPKRTFDFDSSEFKDQVDEARAKYLPLFSVWNDELEELINENVF